MNNFEEKLNKIKVQKISEGERNSIWLGVVTKRGTYKEGSNLLSIFNFKKYMVGALIALLILGGGGGMVVASNAAVPGDALYGLDLAVEKAKVNLASDIEKKDELRIRFADERVAEVKSKSEERESANTRDTDLSAMTVTEIEADVFTNETTVRIEANDRHYGFITAKKVRAEVVAEIATKYNLTVAKVDSMIDFETEDRASRAEDKAFLNSSNSVGFKIESEKEKRDFEMSLKSLSDMDGLSSESQARLNAAINEIKLILEANPDSKIKIENGDFKIEVKENGMIKFDSRDDDRDDEDKDESDDDNRGHGNDDDREGDDNPGQSSGVNVNVGAGVNLGSDVREDDNEVFCRGEWRDPEDCDNNNSDDNDDDNSGSSNGNDDDSEDEDDSDSGNDDDSDSDEDNDNDDDNNSGHGGGDDEDQD